LMMLSFSKPPVGGVEGSPYDGETYIVLIVEGNSNAVFSKPYGYAHMMQRDGCWSELRCRSNHTGRAMAEVWPSADAYSAVGTRKKEQDKLRLAGGSPKSGRA
jgi:hypothetical protein